MVRAKPAALALAGAIAGLTGCQILGPFSISQGRSSYNKVIEETSKEQVFLNVVRVHDHAPTFFMDVSEVDAQVLAQGTVTGGRAALGAHAGTSGGTLAGSTGSVLGSFEYQEAPIIRYLPLQGQPLVQQIATPINVDSISNLSDSNWPLASILTFAANNLTLGYQDYFPALNAIIGLDEYGALVLAPRKSDWTSRADGGTSKPSEQKSDRTTRTDSGGSPPVGPSDALVLYLEPDHPLAPDGNFAAAKQRILQLWIRLLQIYKGTQPPAAGEDSPTQNVGGTVDQQLHNLRNWIELRAAPIPPPSSRPPTEPPPISKSPLIPPSRGRLSLAPLLRTRSALGILKFATEPQSPLIEFVTLDEYYSIRNHNWNQKTFWGHKDPTFYTSVACDAAPIDKPPCARDDTDWRVTSQAPKNYLDLYTPRPDDYTGDYGQLKEERELGHSRRYILVIVSDYIPFDAYVSVSYNGKWYYIAPDDNTSKMNFTLLGQFLTMQAVPPTNPPLTPSISVGARSGS